MLSFSEGLTAGLPLIATPTVIALVFLGSLIGLVVGALPGLTSAMAVAIMIPLTYTLSPEEAFALLLPAYAAGTFGGSIGAILLNIPGTGAAIMTSLDGYPMRMRGEAGRAIGIAATSSVFGGLVSALFLVFAAPIAARWAIRLGAHEYFAVALFGLAVIAYISPSIVKGLLAGAMGLLVACVGNDPAGAYPRFTLDQPALIGGLTFVPVMIGLFGLAEVFWAIENKIAAREPVRQRISGVLKSALETVRMFPVLLRSTILGLFIGVMPASGPTIGSVVAYGTEKRIGKNRDALGSGAPEGIVAAESANNGGTGGALVPMMALGIPGDAGNGDPDRCVAYSRAETWACFVHRTTRLGFQSVFTIHSGKHSVLGNGSRRVAVHPETSRNTAALPHAHRPGVLHHRRLRRAEQRL